jgi:signal transduction histidine kinase
VTITGTMAENKSTPSVLRPEELEAVYAISRAVARSVNLDTALNEIIRLARPVFIFDNMVLYLQKGDNSLEAAYARAIGRGRSQEADLAWGETTALEAIATDQVMIRIEKMDDYEKDRTRLRYSLGLPLGWGAKDAMGALVFIRFGGPSFKPDQIRLSEFIAVHVAQLLGHTHLVQRVATLEAEHRLNRLQEDFIATVSHELLTPLGFIKGYATTLLRDDINWDDNARNEFLTIIDDEADRLRELIENLMDSSRLQAGTLRMSFQPIRLDTFLKDMVLRAGSRNEDIQIYLDLKVDGLQIQADPTRLAQVFDNLLANAIKYAPGSRVMITLSVEKNQAYISVSDNGPGIAPEHLNSLFDRFFRVPTNNLTVRGTGLGLYICRRIVQAHNGEITVESKIGKGTIFHIRLPLEREKGNQEIETSISLRESNQ